MTSIFWVRMNAETIEVEADDYDDAEQQAIALFDKNVEFDVNLGHLDEVHEYREPGDFNEVYTDVHVTIDGEGEWTGELVIREDNEYGTVLREIDYVDEVGMFGAYISGEMHGTFEKENATVKLRGGLQDGDEYCSVYVVEDVNDL